MSGELSHSAIRQAISYHDYSTECHLVAGSLFVDDHQHRQHFVYRSLIFFDDHHCHPDYEHIIMVSRYKTARSAGMMIDVCQPAAGMRRCVKQFGP